MMRTAALMNARLRTQVHVAAQVHIAAAQQAAAAPGEASCGTKWCAAAASDATDQASPSAAAASAVLRLKPLPLPDGSGGLLSFPRGLVAACTLAPALGAACGARSLYWAQHQLRGWLSVHPKSCTRPGRRDRMVHCTPTLCTSSALHVGCAVIFAVESWQQRSVSVNSVAQGVGGRTSPSNWARSWSFWARSCPISWSLRLSCARALSSSSSSSSFCSCSAAICAHN